MLEGVNPIIINRRGKERGKVPHPKGQCVNGPGCEGLSHTAPKRTPNFAAGGPSERACPGGRQGLKPGKNRAAQNQQRSSNQHQNFVLPHMGREQDTAPRMKWRDEREKEG